MKYKCVLWLIFLIVLSISTCWIGMTGGMSYDCNCEPIVLAHECFEPEKTKEIFNTNSQNCSYLYPWGGDQNYDTITLVESNGCYAPEIRDKIRTGKGLLLGFSLLAMIVFISGIYCVIKHEDEASAYTQLATFVGSISQIITVSSFTSVSLYSDGMIAILDWSNSYCSYQGPLWGEITIITMAVIYSLIALCLLLKVLCSQKDSPSTQYTPISTNIDYGAVVEPQYVVVVTTI